MAIYSDNIWVLRRDNMVDYILKHFFTKKKKNSITLIKENRSKVDFSSRKGMLTTKKPESEYTCLSGYFKNNKGLNLIERTTRLKIAIYSNQQ